jgi:hypothetical protein
MKAWQDGMWIFLPKLDCSFRIAFDIKSNRIFLDANEQKYFSFDFVHDVIRAKRLCLLD